MKPSALTSVTIFVAVIGVLSGQRVASRGPQDANRNFTKAPTKGNKIGRLGTPGGRQGEAAERLIKEAMKEADKGMFALKEGEVWRLYITFSLRGVLELTDEGVLKTQFRLHVSWRDPQMSFDPEKYNGYDKIVMPSEWARFPHLVLLENAGRDSLKEDIIEYPIVINSDGNNSMEAELTTWTYCDLDVSLFPNDFHSCQVKIALAPLQIRSFARLFVRHVPSNLFNENPDWPLKAKVNVGVERSMTTFMDGTTDWNVDYCFMNLTVRRNGDSISTALVSPMYCFSFLTALLFILPPSSGERVGTAITMLLTISVSLLSVKDLLPTELPEGGEIYFKTFVTMTFLQTVVAFVETLIVISLCDAKCCKLKSLLPFAKHRSKEYDFKKGDKEDRGFDLVQLATGIDWLFFVINVVGSAYFISRTHSQINQKMPVWTAPEIDKDVMFP